MLRKFAAALLATALIAGPALAQTSGTNGSTPTNPAAQSQPAPAASTAAPKIVTGKTHAAKTHAAKTHAAKTHAAKTPGAKTIKTARHMKKTTRKHLARAHSMMHQARHAKPTKTHQAGVAGAAKRS